MASSPRRSSPTNTPPASRLLGMLLTCVLAGAVVAGLAFPVVGSLTALAAHQADSFENLPAELQTPPLPERSVLLDSDGRVIASLRGAEDRVSVVLASVPVVTQQAVVAIEDSRFFQHHGVDLKGIARALVKNNAAGSTREGASTLTQQYVKNVLLEQADTETDRQAAVARSAERKLREARYALALERKLSKNAILERYLNIAYFGQGVYGVGTAATHYFGIAVEKIDLAQSALLAGLVNSPTRYDPSLHPEAAKARRLEVLQSMAKQGYITDAQLAEADASPLLTAKVKARRADACEGTVAPFFCDYVRTELLNDPRMGNTLQAREDRVFNGGLRIRTTLDRQAQDAAQKAADATVPSSDRIAAVVDVVEPGTGHVLAMAVNRAYGDATRGSTQTKVKLPFIKTWQGGSTFKAFTLTAALQQGIGLRTRISAPPCYASKKFSNPQPRNCYKNAGESEAGTFDLVNGTWFSVNTFFVQLEERTGVQAVMDAAVALGVSRDTFQGLGDASGSVTLGSVLYGVSPLDMATAYATLAAHGKRCSPRGMSAIADAGGKRIGFSSNTPCVQAVDGGVADTVSAVLQGVLTQPHATAFGKGIGRPAAGKTGTLDSQAAAWFVGYTPQMATAVVLGDPKRSTEPMGTVQGVYPVYGGTLPALIWQRTMTAALAGRPVIPLPSALSTTAAAGVPVDLPDVTKLAPAAAKAALEQLGFAVVLDPHLVFSDDVPRGAVAVMSPGPGQVQAGATVTLRVSNGKAPARPGPSSPGTVVIPQATAPAPQPAPAPAPAPAPRPAPTTAARPAPTTAAPTSAAPTSAAPSTASPTSGNPTP